MKIKNKRLAIVIGSFILVSAMVFCTFAADIITGPITFVSDAVKAGIVCEAHLAEHCELCDGLQPNTFYSTKCPRCNTSMTGCCSGEMKNNDYFYTCFVNAHPDGCNTVQDRYWNAYICMECGYWQRGYRDDEFHVEAFWHTKDPTCYSNYCCQYQKLSDLIVLVNSRNAAKAAVNAINTETTTDIVIPDISRFDPADVAAGDYCALHDTFNCTIPHED